MSFGNNGPSSRAEEEQFMSSTGFTTCWPSAECAPGLFTATVEITALSAGGVYSCHIPDLSLFRAGFWEVHIIIRLSLSSLSLQLLRPLSDEMRLPVRPSSLSSCFHALNITFNIYFYDLLLNGNHFERSSRRVKRM